MTQKRRHSPSDLKENGEKSEESIKNPTSLIDLKKKKVKAQAFPVAIYLKKYQDWGEEPTDMGGGNAFQLLTIRKVNPPLPSQPIIM